MEKRTKHWLLIILTVLPLLGGASIMLTRKPGVFTILPGKTYTSRYWTWCDPYSEIKEYTVSPDGIKFTFQLNEGTEYPYSGLVLDLVTGTDLIDATPYKYLDVTLKTEPKSRVEVRLAMDEEGVTDPAVHQTIKYPHYYDFYPTEEFATYRIPIDDMIEYPSWAVQHSLDAESIKVNSYNKRHVRQFIFQNADYIKGEVKTITISEIKLVDENASISFAVPGTLLGYYALLGLSLLLLKNKDKLKALKKEKPTYQPIEVKSYKDQESAKLVSYLEKEYVNPDLSLLVVSEATELSATRISALLTERFHLTFKKYLNQVRLTEAKRLLKETDLNINDIAFKVGYNEMSYFGKLFRKTEAISPREYRKKFGKE